ncbi:MAG: YigZ family protein [Gammaproteobacteria bacterium]|nr:YigZ family protein [Gammaproteobacteria bacterium]
MPVSHYKIPAKSHCSERLVKRSRFVTSVGHAHGKRAAMAFIDSVKTTYADANHHCWAYVAGAPDDAYLVDKSDDGEPRGTAGKPMLNVVQHSGIGQIVVVVTRYFGGIKLGAGGLVRTYSQCVSAALLQLETTAFAEIIRVELQLPYAGLRRTERWLKDAQIVVEKREFDAHVNLLVQVPLHRLASVRAEFEQFSRGEFRWRVPDPPDDD